MADFFTAPLADADPDLAAAIGGERARQRDRIEAAAGGRRPVRRPGRPT